MPCLLNKDYYDGKKDKQETTRQHRDKDRDAEQADCVEESDLHERIIAVADRSLLGLKS